MTRQANLLLSNAAEPAAGIDYANAHLHYGGPIKLTAQGVWGGASVDLVICATCPAGGDVQDFVDNPGNYTWISLLEAPLTANGVFQADNLNPCMVAAKVTSPGLTTRITVLRG